MPFDYTRRLEQVIAHITGACAVFSHIDPARLLIGCSQSRVGGEYGVFASIQGLRFEGGKDTVTRGNRQYRWPRLDFHGREILYVIYFMMPRFADLPYRNKLTTIFHELYHVSPACDGDLRRFPGRNYAHGHSRESYNARLQPWIESYLKEPVAAEATAFLKTGFAELQKQYSTVVGRQLRSLRPVLVR